MKVWKKGFWHPSPPRGESGFEWVSKTEKVSAVPESQTTDYESEDDDCRHDRTDQGKLSSHLRHAFHRFFSGVLLRAVSRHVVTGVADDLQADCEDYTHDYEGDGDVWELSQA